MTGPISLGVRILGGGAVLSAADKSAQDVIAGATLQPVVAEARLDQIVVA